MCSALFGSIFIAIMMIFCNHAPFLLIFNVLQSFITTFLNDLPFFLANIIWRTCANHLATYSIESYFLLHYIYIKLSNKKINDQHDIHFKVLEFFTLKIISEIFIFLCTLNSDFL